MNTDLNTDFTDRPVCPHCGYRHEDAWEWDFGPGFEGSSEFDCSSCEKPFEAHRHVEITYSTTKK